MNDPIEPRPEDAGATVTAEITAAGGSPDATMGAPPPPTHTAKDGAVYEVSEPLRPELAPGETVMAVPDRYCARCAEPRSGRRCPVCRQLTEPNTENAGEVIEEEAPPPAPARRRIHAMSNTRAELERAAERAFDSRVQFVTGDPPDDDDDDGFDDEPIERTERVPRIMRAVPELEPEPPPARPRGFQPRFDRGPSPRREPRRERTPPMAQSRDRRSLRHYQEIDDEGREVHRSGSGRRPKDPRDVVDQMWEDALVDRDQWVRMACAFATAGHDPLKASDLADELYAELIGRQQFSQRRRVG